MDERDIDFVARHYRRGAFSTRRGWERLGIRSGFNLLGLRIAAAVAGLVALGAVAAYVFTNSWSGDTEQITTEQQSSATVEPKAVVRPIDFSDATLTEVAAEVREVYGVGLTGLPDDADECRLTMHYEGNVVDLVEAINELLDTDIKIEEQ